jgi:hypothetical protein
MKTPSFAVVGRPNKGKSSIVATLSRDDSVYIDQRSGSTRRTQEFPMQVGSDTLYVLYDTPGMQRARAVLGWLEQHSSDAASRPATVRRFVEEHHDDPRYLDECEMLRPILAGAGIIYVVDGSCPYGAEYEPEMEILRWTGNPSLALINPIQDESYIEEWKNGLSQYFRTVRVFDAHHAEFRKQLDLLELFGHLDEAWREPLDRAVEALQLERDQQHRASATLIADLIVLCLTHSDSQAVVDGVPQAPVRTALLAKYRATLSKAERRCRSQVEEVFYYQHLQRHESAMELNESDLFNVENWYLWGLSKNSLLVVAATSGALVAGSAGLAVDAATGGLLGGMGTVMSGLGGALLSGAGAWKYAESIGDITVKGIPTGGQRLTMGPSPNLNFPFVVLGRALEHHRMLARRTHAHREVMQLDSPLLDHVSENDRKHLGKLFAQIRKGKPLPRQQSELTELIYGYALAVDHPPVSR